MMALVFPTPISADFVENYLMKMVYRSLLCSITLLLWVKKWVMPFRLPITFETAASLIRSLHLMMTKEDELYLFYISFSEND